MVPCAHTSLPANGISIDLFVSAGLTSVPSGHTDYGTCDTNSNSPRRKLLAVLAMRTYNSPQLRRGVD